MASSYIWSKRRSLLSLLAVFLFSFFAAPSCDATVNKSTASIVVSTTSQDNWYDDKDSSLHTFTVCDKGTGDPYSKYVPCNTDGIHDDYYSTDTDDERNVYSTSQNFTIRASASASSGSMSKVKIEWIAGVTGTPNDSSWTDKNEEPGSYTCSNTGTCTICIEGGSCAHPVIPRNALGVYPDGAQRRFFFRVTFSSSSGDNVTTGWDSTLDKFYRFVICGPKCSEHTCEQYTPSVTPASVTNPADFCSGLNDTNGFFTIGWKSDKMPSNTVQTYYKVSVRKKGTTSPVNSSEASSSATTFKVPSAWLNYDSIYEWQVTVKFKGQGCEWTVTSPWSNGATNINVPHRFPVPRMTVKSDIGADCFAGGCYRDENAKVDGSGSTTSTGSATYAWVLDGGNYSGASFSKVLIGEKHNIQLKVTDSDGHSCSASKNFTLLDNSRSCETGLSASLGNLYQPRDLCNGLNDKDGYYAVSWQSTGLPGGARQTHYEITVRNKTKPTDSHTAAADSASTMFSIPSAWLTYSTTYEWQVKVTIMSADMKCSWNLVSPWSSGAKDIVVPHPYPVPKLTVRNNTNPACPTCNTDCFTGRCQTEENLIFDGSTSTSSTSSPSYAWMLDGANYTGISFMKSFEDRDHTVSLRVTDSDGHSCSTGNKSFSLTNPSCPAGPTVSLLDWVCNDFCNALDYTLKWQDDNMPAGAKQVSYEITVRNKDNPADSHTLSVASPVRIFSVPASWLTNNETFEWQVKIGVVSANGKCSWVVTSPWSSGRLDISVPKQFPTLYASVKNSDNENCLDGDCKTGEDIVFDASDASIDPADFVYDWTVDGSPYSGVTFTKVFDTDSHSFSLKATDRATGQSCTSPVRNFSLGKGQPTWNEIAPH